jgi:hypothetical protein
MKASMFKTLDNDDAASLSSPGGRRARNARIARRARSPRGRVDADARKIVRVRDRPPRVGAKRQEAFGKSW